MALHTRSHLLTAALWLLGAASTTANARYIRLPFSVGSSVNVNTPSNDNTRRDTADSPSVPLVAASSYAFLVNASVGTPGQPIQLRISPSSSDTWLPDSYGYSCDRDYYIRAYSDGDYQYEYYEEQRENFVSACLWGSYNKSSSSSYMAAHRDQQSFYAADAGGEYGTNLTDHLVIGDVEMTDYPMGVVEVGSIPGVLGLGLNRSEISYSYDAYPTILDRLTSSGKINSPAYSIWLDDASGKSGNLLLGAVDKSKLDGELMRLNGQITYGSYSSSAYLEFDLNSFSGAADSDAELSVITHNDNPLSVYIMPERPFSSLPETLTKKIMALAGAEYNETLYYNTIPCDAAKSNRAKFSIRLGGEEGPLLNVELSDLIIPMDPFRVASGYGSGLDPNVCLFGIQNGTRSFYSYDYENQYDSNYGDFLGSSVLRRTYLVYDMPNRQMAFAPVKASSESDIVPFESYGARIPASTAFCTGTYCDDDGTSSGDGPGDDSFGGGGSSGPSSSIRSRGRGWRDVAIGLGVTFGVLALVALIAAIVIWSRWCRGDRAKSVDGEKVDAASGDLTAPSAMMAGTHAATGTSGMAPPPANGLPMIREGSEDGSRAPQLPDLPPPGAITPPAPTVSPPPPPTESSLTAPAPVSPVSPTTVGGPEDAEASERAKGKQKAAYEP